MSENFKVLEALMAASKAKDHDAFIDLWSDDLEYYWSVHSKPVTSKEKLRKFLGNYEAAFDQQEWIVSNWVEKGDLMFCEGIEMIYDRTRDKVIRNPFVQAIEFKDGKVAKMRDYYDGTALAPPAKPATSEAAA